MTVCMYRDIHTTTSHYWPHTTGMPHLKITDGLRISACCTRGFYFSWPLPIVLSCVYVESSWDVMAHGDAREGKWRGNWSMEWVASTLHTTSEHGVFSFTTADGHTLAVSSRLNWCPRRFKWTRPFRPKDEIWFLPVCHHISNAVYIEHATKHKLTNLLTLFNVIRFVTDLISSQHRDTQYRQCTYNVTLRPVRATIVVVEKQ